MAVNMNSSQNISENIDDPLDFQTIEELLQLSDTLVQSCSRPRLPLSPTGTTAAVVPAPPTTAAPPTSLLTLDHSPAHSVSSPRGNDSSSTQTATRTPPPQRSVVPGPAVVVTTADGPVKAITASPAESRTRSDVPVELLLARARGSAEQNAALPSTALSAYHLTQLQRFIKQTIEQQAELIASSSKQLLAETFENVARRLLVEATWTLQRTGDTGNTGTPVPHAQLDYIHDIVSSHVEDWCNEMSTVVSARCDHLGAQVESSVSKIASCRAALVSRARHGKMSPRQRTASENERNKASPGHGRHLAAPASDTTSFSCHLPTDSAGSPGTDWCGEPFLYLVCVVFAGACSAFTLQDVCDLVP